jgi:hypothetical protein
MKDADALQRLDLSRREAAVRGPLRQNLRRPGGPEDLVREYLRRATALRSKPVARADRLA